MSMLYIKPRPGLTSEVQIFQPRLFAKAGQEYQANSYEGRAEKIGNIVYVTIKFNALENPSDINDTNTNSGMYITGIPFVNDDNVGYVTLSEITSMLTTSAPLSPKDIGLIMAGNQLLFVEEATGNRLTNFDFDGGLEAFDLGLTVIFTLNQ